MSPWTAFFIGVGIGLSLGACLGTVVAAWCKAQAIVSEAERVAEEKRDVAQAVEPVSPD